VHLAGNPCKLAELKAIADKHKLILIEDCAQAWGALYRGKPVSSVGQIGCFSLQDSKHISCGDGGVVEKLSRCGTGFADRTRRSIQPRFENRPSARARGAGALSHDRRQFRADGGCRRFLCAAAPERKSTGAQLVPVAPDQRL